MNTPVLLINAPVPRVRADWHAALSLPFALALIHWGL